MRIMRILVYEGSHEAIAYNLAGRRVKGEHAYRHCTASGTYEDFSIKEAFIGDSQLLGLGLGFDDPNPLIAEMKEDESQT